MTMKIVNQTVFVVLLLSGMALAIAIFFDLSKGDYFLRLAGIATFVGWFFGVFAALAYVVSSARFFMSHLHNFWDSLYPVNFGLTLLGVSIMGMDVKQELMLLLLCVAIFSIVSFLLYRFGLLSRKAFPLSILALLFLPAVPTLISIWAYYYFILGVVLIYLSIVANVIGKRKNTVGWSEPVNFNKEAK